MSDDRVAAEACVTRLLANRDHSSGELRKKLKKRGFDGDLIAAVIDDYVNAGWVNDEAFAKHQAQILADQGWGPIQIRGKLTRHGVERDLASSTVDGLDVDWVDTARRRVARRFGELDKSGRERAFRHLTYRGFTADMARRALFD